MICKNCGKEISDTAKFCPYCGKNTSESNGQKLMQSIEEIQNKKANFKFYAIIISIAVVICILGAIIITAIDNKSHEEHDSIIGNMQNSYFEFLPEITVGELLNGTHHQFNDSGEMWLYYTEEGKIEFYGYNNETDICMIIDFTGKTGDNIAKISCKKIDLDKTSPAAEEVDNETFESYILDLYSSYKGTGKSISTTVLETSTSTKNTFVQTTTKQAANSGTTTKVKTTEAESNSETYSITFEADELIEEAELQLDGHVGVAVLSNLTCSNGNANIETETIYIYDSLVRVEVTGATAGEVVLGGTITTYGLDTYQGETVSYPVDSGVFLISKTVGEISDDKPYVDGYVETYALSGRDGSKIRLYLDGDFSTVSVQIQNQEYTSEVEFYSKEDFDEYIEMNFNPFAQPPSVAYVTPYSDSGVAGDTVICDVPEEISGTIQTGGMSYPIQDKKGQINCHSETVAGFTTDYIVNGGAVEKVRNSLGDKWHITAKNACDNYGVTWYELWDSDDGDYYGWVDENFIDFY